MHRSGPGHAKVVWARAHSETWLRGSSPHELVAVWANARTWAPCDARATEAAAVIEERLATYGLDVAAISAAIDRWDPPTLAALLGTLGPDLGAFEPAEPTGSSNSLRMGQAADAARLEVESEEKTILRQTAEALRAEWSDHAAAAVIGDAAFPAFAAKLTRLANQGHDRRDVLRMLTDAGIADAHVRHPAAFAAWKLDRAFAAPAARVAAEGFPQPASEALIRAARPATPAPTPGRAAAPARRVVADRDY